MTRENHELKFEAFSNEGCVCKMTSEYHTKAGVEFKEEDIKEWKDNAMAMYKVVEAYLTKNPEVCLSLMCLFIELPIDLASLKVWPSPLALLIV